MPEVVRTQSVTPSTLPADLDLALLKGTFAGQADALVAPSVIVEVTGAAESRVFTVLGVIDTGLISVPNSGSLQTVVAIGDATEFRLDGILFVNNGVAAVEIQAANGAGQNFIPARTVAARDDFSRTYGEKGLPLTGLKWRTNGASVVAIAWGRKAQ